jgi:Fe-S cluster assembly iron-binding protein IscA
MFNITDEAEIYVADLFAQQGEEDLGLKVDIEKKFASSIKATKPLYSNLE